MNSSRSDYARFPLTSLAVDSSSPVFAATGNSVGDVQLWDLRNIKSGPLISSVNVHQESGLVGFNL